MYKSVKKHAILRLTPLSFEGGRSVREWKRGEARDNNHFDENPKRNVFQSLLFNVPKIPSCLRALKLFLSSHIGREILNQVIENSNIKGWHFSWEIIDQISKLSDGISLYSGKFIFYLFSFISQLLHSVSMLQILWLTQLDKLLLIWNIFWIYMYLLDL